MVTTMTITKDFVQGGLEVLEALAKDLANILIDLEDEASGYSPTAIEFAEEQLRAVEGTAKAWRVSAAQHRIDEAEAAGEEPATADVDLVGNYELELFFGALGFDLGEVDATILREFTDGADV